MKWRGCFLFFLLSFYFITAARGQLITFSVKNERLEKVFLLIEQQSDHHFIYTTEQIEKAKPVTLSVSNEQLTSVLDKCFAGQPLLYNINAKSITVKEKKVVAAERPLRGKVLDQNGNPVRGVTISIKGTPLVVASDSNGEFGFDNAPLNVTLILTSVEIEPLERFVGNQEFVEMRVIIKVGVLDETIVIAYGKTTKRYSTGSVSKVPRSEIEKQPISNLLAALPGRVAGLQVTQTSGMPGTGYTIRLRGQNSIANGNDPLYIIDGIPFPSTSLNTMIAGGTLTSPLANLNPSDIESIEILKDAEATAIFGSRGANGVILITTRKGEAGKTSIEGKVYAGIGKVTRFMNLLNTPEYIAMRKEAFQNDGVTPTVSNAKDLLIWDTTRYTDWQKKLIGSSMHALDARVEMKGGNVSTTFRAGFGYHKETTTLPLDKFGEEKWSANLSVSHRSMDKRLLLSFQSSYLRNLLYLPQGDFSGGITLSPNAPAIYDSVGNLNWEKSTWTNPYSALLKDFRSETDNFISNALISYSPLRDLEIKANIGFNGLFVRDHSRTPLSSFNPALPTSASASFGSNQMMTIISEPQLSYQTRFNKMSIHAVAGITIQSSRQRSIFQSGTGYSSDDLLGSIRAASVISVNSENDIKYRYAGLFSRIAADWNAKYLLSLTARRDGSSRYGTANRFANFGAFGIGWIFSKEKFTKTLHCLSFGKIRMSAGTTGNDQIGDYKFLDTYSSYNYPYQGVTPFVPTQLFNPNFNWELVKKWEVGLDLGFMKDRILLTANYYCNTTDNQLVFYALPNTTGFSGILQNLPAKVRNTGFEIEINTINVQHRNITWKTSFNISVPRNKLLRYDNLKASTYANTYVVGQSLFISKRYHLEGVNPATGLYVFTDVDRDGAVTSPNDRQTIVFTGQQYFGGLANSISMKNLTISFLLQFVRQKNGSGYLNSFARPGVLSNQPTLVLDRWRQPNDIKDVQKYSNSNSQVNSAFAKYLLSDGVYDDASFIRCKNIYISYQFAHADEKQHSNLNLTCFLQAQNIFTITNYKSLDPETKSVMPPIRMITAGIQLNL